MKTKWPNSFRAGGFVAGVLVSIASALAQDSAREPAETAAGGFSIPDKERPFWENAQTFVDAYAARDAEGVGRLFTEDAEFHDEFGERSVGRDAIVALFNEVFAGSPDAIIEAIDLERVRFITPSVALEEGVTHSREHPGSPLQSSRYVVLHLRGGDGIWRIHTLKSFPPQAGGRSEQLSQLVWLLGDWMNEGGDTVVHTSCQWSEDGNYVLRQFEVARAGEAVMKGVQRIGWDPLRKQLRSWTFDSEGGFFDGTWTPSGNQWIVTSSGVTAEGEAATGTAVYTVVDGEMISWHYRNLIIGDTVQEETEPVIMVRRPPQPSSDGK